MAITLPGTAWAGLVYDSSILAPAQGFGTAPRDLTLQASGAETFESGGLGVSATGAIVFGSVVADGSVHAGNGVTNQSGTASLPSPRFDDQKYGAPTIGSLGISSANQIGVLFNATEPGGDGVNVLDVTLKFYSSTGALLGAIDGQQNFTTSNAGNGVAGFTFIVDAAQQDYVNGLLAAGPGTRLALEASIADFAGGPESFLIYNLSAPATFAIAEPAPFGLLLAGLGAVAFAARRRRST
ncbi:MAG TPA: hypothetical protein VFQ20_11790 [Burkholderiaceae bacterium]|nr:hypothetical protein [Burkholderiaceae bacterium]